RRLPGGRRVAALREAGELGAEGEDAPGPEPESEREHTVAVLVGEVLVGLRHEPAQPGVEIGLADAGVGLLVPRVRGVRVWRIRIRTPRVLLLRVRLLRIALPGIRL